MTVVDIGPFASGFICLTYLIVCYRLGRRGKLSFRYTVGWALLFSLGISSILLIRIVEPLADFLKISPAALIAVTGLVLLLTICIQLSVSISGLQEQTRRLSEELALLRAQQIKNSAEDKKI